MWRPQGSTWFQKILVLLLSWFSHWGSRDTAVSRADTIPALVELTFQWWRFLCALEGRLSPSGPLLSDGWLGCQLLLQQKSHVAHFKQFLSGEGMNKSIKMCILFDTEVALPRIYPEETIKDVPKDLTISGFLLPSFSVEGKQKPSIRATDLQSGSGACGLTLCTIRTWRIASRKLWKGKGKSSALWWLDHRWFWFFSFWPMCVLSFLLRPSTTYIPYRK